MLFSSISSKLTGSKPLTSTPAFNMRSMLLISGQHMSPGAVVNVSMDVPAEATPAVSPGHHGVMAQRDASFSVDDFQEGRDLVELRDGAFVLHPREVVVADDEMLAPLQLLRDAAHRIPAAIREIAEDVDVVGVGDLRVPTLDESAVHLLDIVEGADRKSR